MAVLEVQKQAIMREEAEHAKMAFDAQERKIMDNAALFKQQFAEAQDMNNPAYLDKEGKFDSKKYDMTMDQFQSTSVQLAQETISARMDAIMGYAANSPDNVYVQNHAKGMMASFQKQMDMNAKKMELQQKGMEEEGRNRRADQTLQKEYDLTNFRESSADRRTQARIGADFALSNAREARADRRANLQYGGGDESGGPSPKG